MTKFVVLAVLTGFWCIVIGCSAPIMCKGVGGGLVECPKSLQNDYFEKNYLSQKWWQYH